MQKALNYEVAYDLSRFDRRHTVREQVAREKVAEEKKVASRAKAKPVVSGFAVLSWILCMGLLVTIIYSYVVLTETAETANRLEKELADLREETQMLEIQKNQKYGSEQLQQIAVEQLGMQKIEKSQITYVNTNTGDHTEVAQPKTMFTGESKLLAGIASGFDTIVEYIN